MTSRATRQIEADVRRILAQGGDPRAYRLGLAELRCVGVEVVDAAIASIGGTPRQVSAETVAQERLAEDRRMARQSPRAFQESTHEEE